MQQPAGALFARAAALEGVPSTLAATLDAIDARLRDRGLRRTTPELTAEALLRGAVASARLGGAQSTLDDVRRGSADELTVAAMRLNTGLLALTPVVGRSPLQAFARMHALASAGLVADEEVGRPRPDPAAARALVELSRGLLASGGVPALAVAAIVHAEVMVAAPFAMANDLMARGAERLLLVARGVDPACVLVPEAGHLAMGSDYAVALAGYQQGGAAAMRGWLQYAAEALTKSLAECPLPG